MKRSFVAALLGFVLFQGEIAKDVFVVLKMDERTGKTWELVTGYAGLEWKEIVDPGEESRVIVRSPQPYLPTDQNQGIQR